LGLGAGLAAVEKTQPLLPLPGIEPQVLVLSAHSLVTASNELSTLIMKLESPNPAIFIAILLKH
jgi:hypothetical protein